MLNKLNTEVPNDLMSSLISYLEGTLITFDKTSRTVLWHSISNNKYSVATLEKGADWFIGELDTNDYHLENVKDFDDIDAAMLTYLKRKGIKLDIEIDLSVTGIDITKLTPDTKIKVVFDNPQLTKEYSNYFYRIASVSAVISGAIEKDINTNIIINSI